MKLIGTFVIISILVLIFLLRRKKIARIPVIRVDDTLKLDHLEEYYRLDFDYVTTEKGRDLFLSDHSLYIIRGTNLTLSDGDCILVDERIKEKQNKYKLYLINAYPAFSAYREYKILPTSSIKDVSRIIGPVVSKIPADYIRKYRKV